MTDKTPALPDPIASIIAGLKGVTPGPWWVDSERSEGGDGTFNAFAVYGPETRYGHPASICDTHNAGEIRIERDGDDTPWDEQGRVNMDHIARCGPDTMRVIATQLQEALDRAERAEKELVRLHGPCSLGVGCDQYGVCYADSHGKPENCGKPSPVVCDALADARRIADHDKQLWLAAESHATTAEAVLKSARKVIGRSAEGWENAIELGIIAKQHITSAGILRDEARAWLSANPKETT